MPSEESMPKWDVALAAMASTACKQKAAPLTLDDFHQLASEHAIRLDDIMETMFLLVIHGEWRYTDSSGNEQHLDQATLDNLYVKRRLSEEDLATFDGGWQPRQM
jgi:hypothetical protein